MPGIRYNAEQKIYKDLATAFMELKAHMVVKFLKWLKKFLPLGIHASVLCPPLECGWNLTCFLANKVQQR